MKKSYISLALSGVLAGMCGADIPANFCDKNSTGSCQGNYEKVEIENSATNAQYGTHWTGSTSSLTAKSDKLKFTFNNSNTPFDLIFGVSDQDENTSYSNFYFYNGSVNKSSLNLTITTNNPSNITQSTLTFGAEKKDGTYTQTTIYDKDLHLKITGFNEVSIKGDLRIASQSSLNASDSIFTNDAQITLGEGAKLEVKTLNNHKTISLGKEATLLASQDSTNDGGITLGTGSTFYAEELDNKGVIAMASGSTIYATSITGTISESANLLVQGDSEIKLQATANFDISGQWVKVSSGKKLNISKDNSRATAITLGGSTQQTAFQGTKFTPTDNKNLIEVTPSPSDSLIKLTGFTTLQSKNLSLKNISLQATDASALNNTKLAMNNAYLFLGDNTNNKNDTSKSFTLSTSSSSTFEITGNNNAITVGKGTLDFKGTHTFQSIDSKGAVSSDRSTLSLIASKITLGELGTALKLGGDGYSTLALRAKEITLQNLTLQNLTLQAVSDLDDEVMINNKKMLLEHNAMIKATDGRNNLIDLKIQNDSGSLISVHQKNQKNGAKATLWGKNIFITDNKGYSDILIGYNNHKATLTLKATEGITLGESEDTGIFRVLGQNDNLKNNVLDLESPAINLGKNIRLDKLSIVAGNEDEGARFYGTQGGTITLKDGTSISTKRVIDGEEKYSSLFFGVQKAEGDITSSRMIFSDETTFSASDIGLEHQEITLNGDKSFNLYAYGENTKNKTGDIIGVGNFSFSKVDIIGKKGGTRSELKLYGGISDGDVSGGVSLKADDLTLSDVNLGVYQISKTGERNSLEIISTNGVLKTLGKVNIMANGVYIPRSNSNQEQIEQGIAGNLIVGNAERWGQLTIKSDIASDQFVIGGNLTIDSTNAPSTFAVELGGVNKLENHTLGLEILGGITVIHNAEQASQETTIKAKNFDFSEGSTLTSKFGTLKLSQAIKDGQNKSELNLKAKVILEGKTLAEAKLEVGHKDSNGIALTLHDLEAIGKASISHKGITFANSNIIARGKRIKDEEFDQSGGSFTITDSDTSLKGMMEGQIASITLSGANLEFEAGGTPATAGFNLHTTESNKTPFIHSIGDSTLTTTSIKVGAISNSTSDKDARFDLKVEKGTFKLIETEKTENKIRHITLNGGNFAFVKEMDGSDIKNYHSLNLQGDIISEGDSSIKVASLKHIDQEGKISSAGGELGFYLKDNKTTQDFKDSLTFKNNFELTGGSVAFYDGDSKLLDEIKLKAKDNSTQTITSVGNSALRAGRLELFGTNINASGGTLILEGIETTANAGDIIVGDAGIFSPMRQGGAGRANLMAKSVTLSSNAPYLLDPKMKKEWEKKCGKLVSSSCLLGGGVFGQIQAESLILKIAEGSKDKPINIQVKKAEPTNPLKSKEENPLDDSLFALREGAITLIDTNSGIFKSIIDSEEKQNITLEDVNIDKGGYTSLSLTPKLIEGQDWLGDKIVKTLTLDISVSQNNLAGLLEGIANQENAQIMNKIFQDPINALIVESMLQSSDNALKVGMAEYISQGNVPVVSASLGRIRSAMVAMTEGIYASDKILQELKMLRISNLQNRMVRSGNPYVSKTQIAHLIQSLKGVRYASEDDDLLLDEEYSGPNYGAVWASYEGATSFGERKGASVNGLSAGYDTLVGEFKEYLLGFYANYGYGTYGSDFVTNESHNFGLGFYTRMTFGSNEVDLSIAQSIGLNTSRLMQNDPYPTTYPSYVASALKQDLKYNFYLTDAQMRYGYIIKVGDEESPFYFKPFGGLSFGFVANSEAKGEGIAPLSMDIATHFKLDIAVGLEMKKYFNEGSYIYLMPFLEKGIFNDGDIVNIGFVGANKIPYGQFYQVNTAVGIYAGGQGSVGENISITGGVGLRMDIESKEYLTNWNVGFKYKF